MGFEIGIPALILLLVIGALILGTRWLKGEYDSLRSQLQKEFGRMPVYSAETTIGQEAQFIRERLPKRFPAIIVLAIAVIFGVAWWLLR